MISLNFYGVMESGGIMLEIPIDRNHFEGFCHKSSGAQFKTLTWCSKFFMKIKSGAVFRMHLFSEDNPKGWVTRVGLIDEYLDLYDESNGSTKTKAYKYHPVSNPKGLEKTMSIPRILAIITDYQNHLPCSDCQSRT